MSLLHTCANVLRYFLKSMVCKFPLTRYASTWLQVRLFFLACGKSLKRNYVSWLVENLFIFHSRQMHDKSNPRCRNHFVRAICVSSCQNSTFDEENGVHLTVQSKRPVTGPGPHRMGTAQGQTEQLVLWKTEVGLYLLQMII
jgi:hypothetical protein